MSAPRPDGSLINQTIRVVGFPVLNNQKMLPAGEWEIIQRTGQLYCAGLDGFAGNGQEAVVVRTTFTVVKDLNADGVADDNTSGGNPNGGHCVADFDDGSGTGVQDDGVTIDDLLYYL